jgi:hypothetical protein
MAAKPFASSADLGVKEQTLEVLADGVYALTAEGDPNLGAIEGEDFLVCFEALATPVAARRWLAKLREHTDKPVRYLVLSHYHAVRVLGASAFDAEVIVSSEQTRHLIEERGQQDWESEYGRMPRLFEEPESIPGLTWPTMTFRDRLTIELGGDRGELVLEFLGRGHTEGDIVAWLPQHGSSSPATWSSRRPRSTPATRSTSTGPPARSTGSRRWAPAARRRPRGDRPGRGSVDAAIEQTRDFLLTMQRTVGDVHRAGGTLKQAFEATHEALGPAVRRMADLRALPALRRPAAVGRVSRHRAPRHLDRRARPRRVGPAAGLRRDDDHADPRRTSPTGRSSSSAAARSGRPPPCCWPAGACASSSSTAARARPGRQQGHLPAARRPRRLGLRRVGAEIARRGVTWTTARTFHRDAELFSFAFADRGRSPFPPFVNISQCVTEELLDQAIAAQPLVEVRWGPPVVGIEQDDDGVTVSCDGRRRPLVRPTPWPARAARDACAPGARPSTARLRDQFLICDIRDDLPGWETERPVLLRPGVEPGARCSSTPARTRPSASTGRCRRSFDLAPRRPPAASTGESGRSSATAVRGVWKSVYRFHSAFVTGCGSAGCWSPATPRTCLPFGARGLNSGVLDAENAAWKIAFVLRGWAPESLLDSYHDERHAAALENIEVTGATMRFLVPGTEEEPAAASTSWSGPPPTRRPGPRSTPAGWPSRSGTSTRR